MIITNRKLIKLKFINIVFSLIFFTSCELVLNSIDKPVKEFFLENTSTASINHHVINCETFINPITNAVTISSETDVTIIFYMENPQSFIFTKNSNIFLKNDRLVPLPTLEQNLTDKSVLYLKLPKDLLRTFETESVKKNENKTLDFLIELKHPISNVDFQSYSFSIDCNSIPPTIFSPVYYKNANNFVMAFNMPKKSDVKSIHNDLEKLIINGEEYYFSIAEDGTITFPRNSEINSGDVKNVNGIQKIKAEFITLEDYQPFYFVTNETLASNPNGISATLSLMDTANFTSKVSISSNTKTLGSVNLKINEQSEYANNSPIVIQQENDNNAKFTIIAPSHSIDSEGGMENVSDVFVNYTLTNTTTNEVVTGSNNGSGSVTIDVPIGTYKLECISHKDYYADSITTFESIRIKGSLFNFYVSDIANDSEADGSIEHPFVTIEAALNEIYERNIDSPSLINAPYKLILLKDISESNVEINPDPDSELYLTIKSNNNNNTIDAQNNGKVMTIRNNAFVTLENVTLTNGCSDYKGGVEVYGSLTLSDDNCIISNNTVTGSGYGAGIYLGSNAKLTMNGGKITGNTSDDYSAFGGGVYLEDNAKFVMNDGEISYNSVSNGGGVYVSGGTFEMNGGSISHNTVSSNGGGVCVSGGTFIMEGGSISNNTADNNGSGVYVVKSNDTAPTFKISGYASITEDNDVYLANGTTIKVTGNLTSTDTVATITPSEYDINRQVLVAGSGVTLSNSLVKQFNVTAEDDKEWFVDSYGYLGKVPKKEKDDEGNDVYSMESYDNLLWIAQELETNKINSFNIKLTNDIEIPRGKWTSPLDVENSSTMDGQGHSITINEDVSSFGNNAGGLFYRLNNSTVKNLVLKGSITANTSITVNTTNNTTEVGYIGALCRSAYGSIFENVMSEVKITDNGSGFAGGLIGILGTSVEYDASKAKVKNCAVYADVSSSSGTAGGILGAIWDVTRCCTIQNSIYKGKINGTTVGAIAGRNGNNNRAKSELNNIWYCVTNNSSIPLIGTKADTTTENITAVYSKTTDDIASDDAADLLNTDSDETDNYVWEYDLGSAYPTLKTLSSE